MKNYKNNSFLVLEDASIEESLVKIEENKLGLICAINENGHVVGIATDGDIRRAIDGSSKVTAECDLQKPDPLIVWLQKLSPPFRKWITQLS